MGLTQWALAVTRPPYLKAMAVGLTTAGGGRSWFPGGSFALDIALPWTMTMVFGFGPAQQPELQQRLLDGFDHLPLRQAAAFTTGQKVHWWDRWMDHPSIGDPFWAPLDFTSAALDLDVPILFTDGWYDYATVHLVREFQQRDQAGLPSRLVVGPGTHFDGGEKERAETLAWFDHHLKGRQASRPSSPVSVYVLPDLGWRTCPPGRPRGLLAGGTSGRSAVWGDRRRRAPAARLTSTTPLIPRRRSEGRAFAWTTAVPSTTATRGPGGRADLHLGTAVPTRPDDRTHRSALFLRSDVDDFDVYLRVCDVLPTGESINVSEVIRRLTPADIERDGDGAFEVVLDVRPVAQEFATGHRIRVQLSGGAHPMFARNTCSGEPFADAVTKVVAHNEVLHSEHHPSSVTMHLPA